MPLFFWWGIRLRPGWAPVARATVLAALGATTLLSPARAQWTPRVETRVPNPAAALPAGELVVNGVVVLRLRSELGGYLPEQRVEVAGARLRAAIAQGLRPEGVLADVITDKANPRLKAAGQVIATATADDAKGAGLTAGGLAESWAAALRKALAIPGLAVASERVVVPVGETRVLRVSGAARGPVSALTASGDTRTLALQVDPATGDITLRGLAPGKETLTVSREGATVTATVAVQLYAGRIDAPRPVTVTGAEVPTDLVTRHVLASALAAARPTPGATIQAAPPASIAAPAAGQTRAVGVSLQLSGPDMIPVRGVVRVPVGSRTLPPVATGALFYSNNPERVTRYGTLFVARLPRGVAATRLLYHHQSALDRAATFTVELINDGDTPATVQIVGGAAGPVLDTVWVGYRAASLFVRDFLGDIGAFVDVPARSRVPLTVARLAPGLTISGLTQLRQTTGAPLLVRVAADLPGDERTATTELVPTPNPWAAEGGILPFPLSDHVYPEPRKTLKAEYRVGERWAFVSIGRHPISGTTEARRLEGNFGVFYDIELKLENPTDRPATVQLVFEPSAGLAGGIFLVDGRAVEIPQAKGSAEITLARYPLAPGAKQTVQVKTLPLSGSNYPIRLTVRPGPVPVAARPVPPADLPAPLTPVGIGGERAAP